MRARWLSIAKKTWVPFGVPALSWVLEKGSDQRRRPRRKRSDETTHRKSSEVEMGPWRSKRGRVTEGLP